MSEIINKAVNCPRCGEKSMEDIVCSMNTVKEPQIREKLFDGSFFEWKCPKCGYRATMLHPLLYSDLKRRFMVYFIPNVERSQIADEKIENEYAELKDIKKRIVPNVNALKEKIFLLENGYNDMACELSKLAVAEVVSKSTGQNVHDGYCTEIDRTENTITFQFFIGSDHRSLLQTTRYDVYQRSMRIVKEYFADIDMKKGFLNIDQSWAKEALRRYKTSD